MDGDLLEFDGEDDHVHLLIACHPKTALANLVGKLKGQSSYIFRQEFRPEVRKKMWGDHFWSPSYGVVSCREAPLEIIRAYVENQRKPSEKKHVEEALRFANAKRARDKTWIRERKAQV